MARKKVNQADIFNDSARKGRFRKRKAGLLKKLSALITLCDVDACTIIYSPHDPRPDVFPSEADVLSVLAKFRAVSEMEQCKKMVNQEDFLRQRIAKAIERLKKLRKDNREGVMKQVMFQSLAGNYMGLQGFGVADLSDLSLLVDHKLKHIHKSIEKIAMNESSVQMSAAVADGNQTRGGERTNEVADGNQARGGKSSNEVADGNRKRSRESTTEVADAVAAPTMGGEDMSVENNGMPGQEWSMDLMNPQDQDNNLAQHVEFDWDEMIFPFGDNLWSDDYFFF